MSANRKNMRSSYKKLPFRYSVYGENKEYSANATIDVHKGSYTETPVLELTHNFETFEEAEIAIIRVVKNWIDNHT